MSDVAKVSARTPINFNKLPETRYCIENWLRDEQIKVNLAREGVGRIQPHPDRTDKIAVVGFGPSLKDTWEELKAYKYIITTSGAHKFLLERGIVPTWHLEVDPRAHKIELLGEPHPDVTYLPASTVHPKYFDKLEACGCKVEMWHVFDGSEEGYMLPRGEWAVLGGIDAGQRAMAMAAFFGFKDQHCFGIDGSSPVAGTSKHASPHPLQDRAPSALMEWPEGSGRMWNTSVALVAAVKQIWHELDMMPSVRVTFHGEGLIQEMAKTYVRNIPKSGVGVVADIRPTLISEEYRAQQAQLHASNLAFGVGGGRHADTVKRLKVKLGAASVLDYGSGKGYLAKALPFPIWEYDPAIPEKSAPPRPAELVVCTDVLEHIEEDKLVAVLDDLRRVTKKVGFFVIHTGPSSKLLPDGRNAHLIQQGTEWWRKQLEMHFVVASMQASGPLLYCVVSARKGVKVSAKAA
jgi:hypothetical protein